MNGAARASGLTLGRPRFDGLDVVLVDSRGRRSATFAASLERAGGTVRTVPTLADAGRCAAAFDTCATVLVDLPAPGMTDSVQASLQALSRRGAVLLVSEDVTARQRIELLHCGADNVLGSGEPDEAVAALAAILRRARTPVPRAASHPLWAGEICVHPATRTATASGRPLVLTPLEFDLLAYFVTHAGQALSRDQLLEHVWGYQIGGRETVTVHVRRLRTKIEADPSRPELLQTVWGTGYRLNPDVSPAPASPRPVAPAR
ncbi:MAG: response regulator transcription factor [Actinomycetota bacterium]|nr:response regulator transcription factor [Actinomycetota bacterium]